MKNAVDGTTWNDSLSSALRAYKLGDLDLAEQRLDKAFATADKDVPYLQLLAGHIAHARGSQAEAEKAWKNVLDMDPENAEAWNNLGVLYRKQGDDDKALAAFQEAAEKATDRPDIHYNIGNLYKSAGRFDEAISAYNRSIEIDSAYAPAYNNLGTLYESRRERDKALEVFKRGLTADTGDASLRFNMGLVFQEEERWDDAREAFDRALKSRPGWTPGLNNLGIVLQEMGREDDAARTFRTLLDIEPDNVSALNNLGVAYDHLGRSKDARDCFRKALKEEPDYIKAALNLHDSYQDSQELNEALEEINKQITHHPRDPEIRVRMGRTLIGLTRWDEAERSLDHVLERNPEHRDALRAKAELYLATKRPKDAEAILKQLPHDTDVVRDLARLNIATDKPVDAERILGELVAVNPDDAESRRLLSDLLTETNPEEAVKLREEAAEADPGDTNDLISLAELYGKTGSRDAALAKLDEAVNLLGSRGEAEDLDTLSEVLSLYEKAATALDEEKGDLFAERSAQLGRKLQSAIGNTGYNRSKERSLAIEIPLEQEDALSLLDLNAMEPVIRINEEEETVFLDEEAEDLEDAWTELSNREMQRDEAARNTAPSEGSSNGPPVHIHLPSQPAGPVAPQVIYQDIRPVPQPSESKGEALPEMIVEEIIEEEIPLLEDDVEDDLQEVLEEEPKENTLEELEIDLEDEESMDLVLEEEPEIIKAEDMEIGEEELLEEQADETEENEDEEDNEEPFFIPESDALSEDLPESAEPVLPDADLLFADENPEDNEIEVLEEEEEVPFPEDALEELEILSDPEDLEEPLVPIDPPEIEPVANVIDTEKVAGMFKYLSDLTDETTGESREQLIEKGIPLKLAGLHARLSGEPNFREVAHKYDRRSRERHNIELNEEKIRESLSAFKDLAEAFPIETVRESLSKKLGKIMNGVGKLTDQVSEEKTAPTEVEKTAEEEGAIPEGLLAGLAEEMSRSEEEEEFLTAHEDFAAVLPPDIDT